MTRQEFIDNIECWSELIEFCNDNNLDCCEDIYDDDERDSYVNELLVDMARDADDWKDLLRQLDDIPEGYVYYTHNDYDGWREADDDDFEGRKLDVLAWGDDNEIWDEEDDVEEYVPEEEAIYRSEKENDENEDDNEVPEEECSLGELFVFGAAKLQTIELEAEQKRKEEEESFHQFITVTA